MSSSSRLFITFKCVSSFSWNPAASQETPGIKNKSGFVPHQEFIAYPSKGGGWKSFPATLSVLSEERRLDNDPSGSASWELTGCKVLPHFFLFLSKIRIIPPLAWFSTRWDWLGTCPREPWSCFYWSITREKGREIIIQSLHKDFVCTAARIRLEEYSNQCLVQVWRIIGWEMGWDTDVCRANQWTTSPDGAIPGLAVKLEKLPSQLSAKFIQKRNSNPDGRKDRSEEASWKAVCGYFLKRLSFEFKAKARQNCLDTVLYISIPGFCGEGFFALRSSSRVEFGLKILNAGAAVRTLKYFQTLTTWSFNLLFT